MNKVQKYTSAFLLVFGLIFSFAFHTQGIYAALPVCSDLVDNDADGLVDSADPQCHIDGDATNPGSWDEFGTSERSFVPPVVNAGPDVSVVSNLATVVGAATASDADGTVDVYLWTLVSGPGGSSITSGATLATDFSNLSPGVYVFKIKVTDNDGLTAEDDFQITVTPPVTGGGGGGIIIRYVCSDGLDNDNDGIVDANDPGCHSDGNVSNPNSYIPTDPDETNIVVPVVIPTPVVVTPTPVPQVLGASVGPVLAQAQTCGGTTGRPCRLQKTGGVKISERTALNRKATVLAKSQHNELIISKLGITQPILSLKSQDSLFREAMILPWTSTPDKGGNTVLVGHAYYSRDGKQSKSTFYELDTLKAGDEITMYWKDVKYTYVVSETKKVTPDDISVENQTETSTLTIYSCGRFTNKLRTVVVATLKV